MQTASAPEVQKDLKDIAGEKKMLVKVDRAGFKRDSHRCG